MTIQHNRTNTEIHLIKKNIQSDSPAYLWIFIVVVLGLLLSACTPQEAGRKSRGGRWTQIEGHIEMHPFEMLTA